MNSGDSNWYISTKVDLVKAGYGPRPVSLPTATLLANTNNTLTNAFYVAVNDNGVHPTALASGSKMRFEWANDANNAWTRPANFYLDESTGRVNAVGGIQCLMYIHLLSVYICIYIYIYIYVFM